MKVIFFYFVCLCTVILGCGSSDIDPSADLGVPVTSVDVSDADSLVIVLEGGNRTLRQIHADGTISDVLYYDAKGNKGDAPSDPDGIYDVDDIYVALHFLSRSDASSIQNDVWLLIRQEDGAVFVLYDRERKIGSPIYEQFSYPIDGYQTFQVDSAGNIYFLRDHSGAGSSSRVARIDTTDRSQLNVVNVTPVDVSVKSFTVGSDGTVVYEAFIFGNEQGTRTEFRVETIGGSTSILGTLTQMFWRNHAFDLFLATTEDNRLNLDLLAVVDNAPTLTRAGYVTNPHHTHRYNSPRGTLLQTRDRVFVVGKEAADVVILELDNP